MNTLLLTRRHKRTHSSQSFLFSKDSRYTHVQCSISYSATHITYEREREKTKRRLLFAKTYRLKGSFFIG